MSNDTSYLRSDDHLKEAHEQLNFLTCQGFRTTLYPSSILYSKDIEGVKEEISVRVVKYATLRVDHSKIKRLKTRQVVKTNTVTGNLDECIAYVEGRFKIH